MSNASIKKAALVATEICMAVASRASILPARFGALWYPGETAVLETGDAAFSRVALPDGGEAPAPVFWRVTDWLGEERASGALPAGSATLSVPHSALGGRFGAFRLAIGTNETWFAFLPSREVAPCGWVGTGTHGGHGWQKGDLRYLDLVAAAGIGAVRDDVIWNWHEKKRGEIVFTDSLRAMARGLAERGIGFVAIVNGKNDIYDDPLDPDAFARFSAAAAREFGSSARIVEIFNEPHNFCFPHVYLPEGVKFTSFQCDPKAVWVEKHATLTRKAADAIRAAAPGVDVGVGAEDWWDLFKKMLENQPLARKGDVVTIHSYDHFQSRPELNWFFRDGGREVREHLLANGGADRIAITECGWTTYDATGGGTHAAVGNYPPSTLVEQAQYLVRFYLLARQHGVEFACQYDFMDDGNRRDYTEHNFGFVRADYTPKPSFAAVAAMTRLVGDAEPLGLAEGIDRDKVRIYRFGRPDGSTVSAAWAVQGDVLLDAGVLQATDAQAPVFFDLMGNEIPPPLAPDGRLRLSERPFYVVDSGRQNAR